MRIATLVAMIALAAAPASAQNGAALDSIELYPTWNNIGARVHYHGDANANASGHLEWRVHGEAVWQRGVDLVHRAQSARVDPLGAEHRLPEIALAGLPRRDAARQRHGARVRELTVGPAEDGREQIDVGFVVDRRELRISAGMRVNLQNPEVAARGFFKERDQALR